MSNPINTNLIERANELIEEITSHPSGYDRRLQELIVSNDLEALYNLVIKIEGLLAQEHFRNYEIVKEYEDVY